MTEDKKSIEIFEGWWSVSDVSGSPHKLFVFGDNDIKKGKKGQAIIRDLKNSAGIPTKKLPSNKSKAFYSDDELEQNMMKIDTAIALIKDKMKLPEYTTLVFPENGIGTGLAKLASKAPRTFKYLNYKIRQMKKWFAES